MSQEKIDLEESEYPLGIKIFSTLRWIMVGCLILTFVGGIYLLFKGYAWYFVIPGYFVVNFFFRVMRSYFRNIAEDLKSEYADFGKRSF
jgi:uncharacterized membrane protein